MAPCAHCGARALIIRPKTRTRLCRTCFLHAFETEVHDTITSTRLFYPGEAIAIGASGGKDSTVLASVLATLNARHGYKWQLTLLSVDEGIAGYRDDSLAMVRVHAEQLGLPLLVVPYKDLYGWTMDEVVGQVGKRGNCTYCGVFRRQALDRGAARLGVRHVVTGHNADDVAETVLMNLLRGDVPRLARATSIVTDSPAPVLDPGISTSSSHPPVKRSKPLKHAYEKEIVLYAHHARLPYFSTECVYSPDAFRGTARSLVKDLERIRPAAILDLVRSGEDLARLVPPEVAAGVGPGPAVERAGCGGQIGDEGGGENQEQDRRGAVEHEREAEVDLTTTPNQTPISSNSKLARTPAPPAPTSTPARRLVKAQTMHRCTRCGYMSSQMVCKACSLLEGLNRSRPRTTVILDS